MDFDQHDAPLRACPQGESLPRFGAARALRRTWSGTVILSVQGQAPNQSQPQEEMEKIRKAIPRSRPYGSEKWVGRAVAEVGLEKHHAQPRASEKRTKQRYLTPFPRVTPFPRGCPQQKSSCCTRAYQ